MKKLFIVIATLCLFSIPSTVVACSCATGDPPFEFNKAKAVFIGRMLGGTEKLSMKDPGAKRAYKLVLSSNAKRERAHAFYESLGFERHGVSFRLNLSPVTQ